MAQTPLQYYSPAGSNIIRPTATQQGRAYALGKLLITDETPLETPAFARMRNIPAQPQTEQSEFVDGFKPITTLSTPVCIGAPLSANLTTVPTERTAAPNTNSNVNNRAKLVNYLQKNRFEYCITEEAQDWAKQGSSIVTDEKMREIQRQTDYLLARVEFDIFTNNTGVEDLMDQSTAGEAAGICALLAASPANWANIGWVPNVNVKYENGVKIANQPAAISDITEDIILGALLMLHKGANGKDKHLFAPSLYHDHISRNFKGRDNVTENQDRSSHLLDYGLEVVKAASGMRLTVVPSRTMSDEVLAILDMKQVNKRISKGFALRPLTDGQPDHRGYGGMTWSVLSGDPRSSCVWFTSIAPA